MPIHDLIFLSLLSFGTSVISGALGSGGGEIFLVGMNMPLKEAIPIHAIVQIFNNSHRFYLLKKHLKKFICVPYIIGSLLGAMGVFFFVRELDNKFLPYILIILTLLYTLFRPKKLPAIKLKKQGFFFLGLSAGFLGVLIGIVGPLISPFFLRNDLSPKEIVANKSFLQFVSHVIKLPVFFYLGFSFSQFLFPLFLFVVCGMLGTYVGVLLLGRVKERTFYFVFKFFLFIVTIKMIYSLFLLIKF